MSKDFATIGKQGDSPSYFASAKSFAASGTFLLADGSYNNVWPPAYPIALSLHAIEGIPIGVHARLLHCGYYLGILLFSTLILGCGPRQCGTERICLLAFLAAFPPTLFLVANALSELQYGLLSLFTLAALWSWAGRRTKAPHAGIFNLLFASLLCAMALMTRLQGLLLLLAGGLAILAILRPSLRQAIPVIATWVILPLGFLTLWLTMNYVRTGVLRPTGGPPNGYFSNVSSFGLSSLAAFIPLFGQGTIARAGVPLRLIGAAGLYIPLVAALISLAQYHAARLDSHRIHSLGVLLSLYSLTDIVGLPVMASVAQVDAMHYRFVHASLLCALLSGGLIFVSRPRPAWARWGLVLAAAGLSCWGLLYVHWYSKGWSF